MSDETGGVTDEPPTAGGAGTGGAAGADAAAAPDPDADGGSADGDGPRFRRMLNYGLLAGLLVLALVAAVGLYTAVLGAISTWVTREWRPVFRAAFNLVVLLVAGSGIAWQARRMW